MAEWTSPAAFEGGEPCPSCDRPVLPDLPSVCLFDIDVLRGHRDDPQRLDVLRKRGLIKARPTNLGRRTLRRHKEDAEWLGQHRAFPDHPSSASWTVGDSQITGQVHCMECCPPPPMSEEQQRQITAILTRGARRGPETQGGNT